MSTTLETTEGFTPPDVRYVWNHDAPEGMCWKCPDCTSLASLGGNAGYHMRNEDHGIPSLRTILVSRAGSGEHSDQGGAEAKQYGSYIVPPFAPSKTSVAVVFCWWSWHPLYPYWSRSCWKYESHKEAMIGRETGSCAGLNLYHNKLIREEGRTFTEVADDPCRNLPIWEKIAGNYRDGKRKEGDAVPTALRTNDVASDGARGASPETQSVPESAGQSDTPTPETDAEALSFRQFKHVADGVSLQFARTLEHQRDEARAALDSSNTARPSKELAEARATIAKLHKLSNRLDELLPRAANPSLTPPPGAATD